MTLVNADMLAAIRTNVRAIFMQGLTDLAPQLGDWQKIATKFDSTTDRETYSWLGANPPMSEWTDQRQLRGLRPFDYTLVNKHWEATLEIERTAIEDNRLGHIPARVRQLIRTSLRFLNEKVVSQLDGGATLLAYDGAAFFADTRVIGASANIDNLISGSYSGSSAEIRTAISVAAALMMNYQDDWGKPLGLMPDTIVCSPAMMIPIKEALKADVAGQQRAETEFVKTIITSPWVDADTLDWYILCTTEEVKPILFQNRQNAEVNA